VLTEEFESPNGETIEVEFLEVDTRRLICGEALAGAPEECKRAPRPE
jgi:hypothetical protein